MVAPGHPVLRDISASCTSSTNSTTRARYRWMFTSYYFLLFTFSFSLKFGGWGRNRTGVHGFAGRCITTLPPSQKSIRLYNRALIVIVLMATCRSHCITIIPDFLSSTLRAVVANAPTFKIVPDDFVCHPAISFTNSFAISFTQKARLLRLCLAMTACILSSRALQGRGDLVLLISSMPNCFGFASQ